MTVKARADVTVADIRDVSSTTRYYLLQASTAATPAKPTATPPPSPWTTTEPTYNAGDTSSMYTTDLTIFSDGTFMYSDVSLSTSYEAAKSAANAAAAAASMANTAQTTAQNAQTTADGKNKIFAAVNQPSSTGLVPGDLWFQLDSSSNVTGIQVWNGSGFADFVLYANEVLVAGSVGTIQLANGAVTADQITASTALLNKLLVRKLISDDIDVGSLSAAIVTSGLFKTSGTADYTIINTSGVTVYKGGKPYTHMGSDAPNGLQLWNNATGMLTDVSNSIFGGMTSMYPMNTTANMIWWYFGTKGQITATTNRILVLWMATASDTLTTTMAPYACSVNHPNGSGADNISDVAWQSGIQTYTFGQNYPAIGMDCFQNATIGQTYYFGHRIRTGGGKGDENTGEKGNINYSFLYAMCV